MCGLYLIVIMMWKLPSAAHIISSLYFNYLLERKVAASLSLWDYGCVSRANTDFLVGVMLSLVDACSALFLNWWHVTNLRSIVTHLASSLRFLTVVIKRAQSWRCCSSAQWGNPNGLVVCLWRQNGARSIWVLVFAVSIPSEWLAGAKRNLTCTWLLTTPGWLVIAF